MDIGQPYGRLAFPDWSRDRGRFEPWSQTVIFRYLSALLKEHEVANCPSSSRVRTSDLWEDTGSRHSIQLIVAGPSPGAYFGIPISRINNSIAGLN